MSLFFFLPTKGTSIQYAIDNSVVFDTVGDGSRDCQAGVRFNTDGTADSLVYNFSYSNDRLNWVTPTAVSSEDHWIKFERISGDTDGFTGTLSTWLQLSGGSGSAREIYYYVLAGAGLLSGQYSAEIATDASGTNVVAGPTTFTITANSELT